MTTIRRTGNGRAPQVLANTAHLNKIQEGAGAWNAWRKGNPRILPDLVGADLSGLQLSGANLQNANLCGAKLDHTNLAGANLSNADLGGAVLTGTVLSRATLSRANLSFALLEKADLAGASGLESAVFKGAIIKNVKADAHALQKVTRQSTCGTPAGRVSDETLAGSAEGPRSGDKSPSKVPLSVSIAVISIFVKFLDVTALGIAVHLKSRIAVAAVSVLLLIGILRRNRLAWQWGRLICALDGTVLIVSGVVVAVCLGVPLPPNAHSIMVSVLVAVCVQCVASWAIFIAFGCRSAREYFHLVCPLCGSTGQKAADFFFRKVRCPLCAHQYTPE